MDLPELAARILDGMQTPETAAAATYHLARCRSLGLVSDWEGCAKVDDFARLIVSATGMLPPGGSIETGVYQGGSAGPLILVDSPESFHVSIDPYGLPSQSYPLPNYGNWERVRQTLTRLAFLGEERRVTVCHYLLDSLSFVRADLLQHPGSFRLVHLDGDHSRETVLAELEYFRRRISGPAIFLLDDHDDHFPGVEEALQTAGQGLVPILHRYYDFPNYGIAGFSAWLHYNPAPFTSSPQ